MNWISNFAVSMAFPWIASTLGEYSFVPFAVFLFCSTFFIYVYVVETKGRTIVEIQQEFARLEGGQGNGEEKENPHAQKGSNVEIETTSSLSASSAARGMKPLLDLPLSTVGGDRHSNAYSPTKSSFAEGAADHHAMHQQVRMRAYIVGELCICLNVFIFGHA